MMRQIFCIDFLVLILSASVMCDDDCGGTRCEDSKRVGTSQHDDAMLVSNEQQAEAKEGSLIKSNNLSRRRREIVEAMMTDMKISGALTNKCVGGECSQDSDRREGKENETPGDVSLDEKNKIAEMQLEKELQEEIDTGASLKSVYATISAYLRGLFLLPDARFNLKYLANTQPPVPTPQVQSLDITIKPSTPRILNPSRNITGSSSLVLSESRKSSYGPLNLTPSNPSISKMTNRNTTHPNPDSPTLVLECSGPITSYCQTRHCRVKCIDGRKVEMMCGTNSLDIKTSTGVDGISRNTISCSQ